MIENSWENGQVVSRCKFDGQNVDEIIRLSSLEHEWWSNEKVLRLFYNNQVIELNVGDTLVKYPKCKIEKENGK